MTKEMMYFKLLSTYIITLAVTRAFVTVVVVFGGQ